MRYTVIENERGRLGKGRELNRVETDDIKKAIRIKINNEHNKVGVATTIIDNETGKKIVVEVKHNTRTYGYYIKMY